MSVYFWEVIVWCTTRWKTRIGWGLRKYFK